MPLKNQDPDCDHPDRHALTEIRKQFCSKESACGIAAVDF